MRVLAWTLGALAAALAFLAGVALAVPEAAWPPRAWTPPPGPYKVGVMGDIQKGLTNARNLVDVLRREGVSLTLQTGDLVSDNDDAHYRLAARCVRKLPGSFRTVPGNHDVKGGVGNYEQAFELDWEIDAGPLMFVGLNNALGESIDLARLEARTAGKEAVVILAHIPDPALRAWVEKTPRVKYVFHGHRHEFKEEKVGAATLVVNGIGGDYNSWQLDQRVKAVVLEVDGPSIRHRVIDLPPEHGLWDNLVHLAVGHVGLGAWPLAFCALFLALFCARRYTKRTV